jgi:PAS domain S-box-containing protein
MNILLENEKRMKNINIELKNSKELLEKSYNQLNKIYLNIKDAVFVISEDYKILFKNDTARDIFGTDLIGKDCYKVIKGQDQPCEHCPIIRFAESEESLLHFEQCVNTPLLKEERFFDVISSQIEEYGGQPAIVEVLLDITERKKAEQKLKESEEKYRLISENANDMIYFFNEKYEFEYINEQAFMKYLGYSKDDLLGRSGLDFVHPEDMKNAIEKLKIGFNSGKSSTELRLRHKNDRYHWHEISGNTFIDMHGKKKFLLIDREITERKKAEQELKESGKKYREAYNRAELYKDIFAHDINNILQSILSGTQISELILDNPEKLDNLKINARIIKEQVIRGAKLVSNVRKLSQLEEAGRNLEKIEILNVLKNTISFVKKSYKDKNLAIRIDSIIENLFVKANDFLEDVFENLLINAIKHNKNLLVDITVRISREQQNGINYLKMEFLDNGVGVDDIVKEKIFQRGYSKEEIFFGMGLGLSLVRGIIETYNGKIWVEDRVKGDRSKGSNFVLLIPEVI